MVTDKKSNNLVLCIFSRSNVAITTFYEYMKGKKYQSEANDGDSRFEYKGWVSEAAARDGASARKKGRKNEFTKSIRPVKRTGERGSPLVHYNTALIHKLNTETTCFCRCYGFTVISKIS